MKKPSTPDTNPKPTALHPAKFEAAYIIIHRVNRHWARAKKSHAENASVGMGRRERVFIFEEDGCWSKVVYGTWAQAETAAARTMDESLHRRTLLAYRCDFCGKWHVGGDAPRIRNRVLSEKSWAIGSWRVLMRASNNEHQGTLQDMSASTRRQGQTTVRMSMSPIRTY